MKLFTTIKDFVIKFLKFGVVGFTGMIVDYGFFYIFKEIVGLPVLVSNMISFTLAATFNYILNRIWTFRSQNKKIGKEYLSFFLISLIGLGINTLTLFICDKCLFTEWDSNLRIYVLKLIAIAVTTIWNFFGNLLFTFRTPKAEAPTTEATTTEPIQETQTEAQKELE